MTLFKVWRSCWRADPVSIRKNTSHPEVAGFTLLEMLVVAVMVGVLAAIAVPSWLSFVQQRRANVVQDDILRSLQQAQTEAKRTKLTYYVSFRMNTTTNLPQVAVYPSAGSTSLDTAWRDLGSKEGIKANQVILYTNITGTNVINGSATSTVTSTVASVAFDYTGGFPTDPTPNLTTGSGSSAVTGLYITAAVPRRESPTNPIPNTRRCVVIKTLLGSMQTQSGSDCRP